MPLCGTEGEIQLTVSDLGVGFDPQDAIYRRGLGLISMRERMQLVGGEFSINSHPGSALRSTLVCRSEELTHSWLWGKEHPIWCSKLA